MSPPTTRTAYAAAFAVLIAEACTRHPARPRSGMAHGGIVRVYELDLPEGVAPAERARLATQSGAAVAARLDAMQACDCEVHVTGDRVAVGSAAQSLGDDEATPRALAIRGVLEFGEVTDAVGLASLDPEWLARAGVRVSTDRWFGAGVGERDAHRLEADNVARLRSAVASLPPGTLAPDVTLRVVSSRSGASDLPAEVAYAIAVRTEPMPVNRYVREAQASTDRETGRPLVRLVLDPAGAAWFTTLTRRLVGRKLAIMLDGEVQSAPVVMQEIRGGNLTITMGGAQAATAVIEAERLAGVLRTPPLPVALRLDSEWLWVPRAGHNWWIQ